MNQVFLDLLSGFLDLFLLWEACRFFFFFCQGLIFLGCQYLCGTLLVRALLFVVAAVKFTSFFSYRFFLVLLVFLYQYGIFCYWCRTPLWLSGFLYQYGFSDSLFFWYRLVWVIFCIYLVIFYCTEIIYQFCALFMARRPLLQLKLGLCL
jgi:hypothetical protein